MIIDFERVPKSAKVHDAIVERVSETKLGHIQIDCTDVTEIFKNGEAVRQSCADMYFIVPVRRKKSVDFAKTLKQHQAVRLLQYKDARSNNHTIAEIQIL